MTQAKVVADFLEMWLAVSFVDWFGELVIKLE
jgi:hypothetical protein